MNARLQHRSPSTRASRPHREARSGALSEFDRIRRTLDGYLEKAGNARKRLLGGPYDPKLLHAWRVSLRRVIATLNGLARLSDDDLGDVLGYLRQCREATGQCRDIDILAQETLPAFMGESPPSPADTMLLQQALAEQQRLAHEHALAALKKADITTPIRAWRRWCDSLEAPTDRLVRATAARVIEDRYSTLKKRAAQLDGGRKRLHRLRTATKKLRYNVELYQELFPRRTVDHWLDQLADLQTHLGLAHDRMMGRNMLTTLVPADNHGAVAKPFRRWTKHTAYEASHKATQSLAKLDKLGRYWRE
ncbi:CHAD domain-containing protein [Dyella soli]|uniref:CHAD domain-containing protein n=1 Tax=Dyella soli TaxID=522319 RepID=A0A4R0YQ72_9GAMM|nr:CHAD domain-containing protein [Dyella soli]TCI10045.1 CHAD domain-containing protein [Dyella soli]